MDRNRVLKIVTHQQNNSMGLIAPQNLKHPKNQGMYIYHNYESIEYNNISNNLIGSFFKLYPIFNVKFIHESLNIHIKS